MTQPIDEYRFWTTDSSGEIRLHERDVESTVRRGLTRWSFRTPYADLDPTPTHLWTTSSSFWCCLAVGLLGIFGATYELLGFEDQYLPRWTPPLMICGSIALLMFAYRIRREEWVIFACGDNSCVRYSRNGPNAEQFSAFTGRLVERIHAARSGEPSDAPKSRSRPI